MCKHKRRYFSSPPNCPVSPTSAWSFGICIAVCSRISPLHGFILSPVMELRVTPGQAATAAVAVCSINTNFNWKTIQLTKSVKRVGRLESASQRVWRPLSVPLHSWLHQTQTRLHIECQTPNCKDHLQLHWTKWLCFLVLLKILFHWQTATKHVSLKCTYCKKRKIPNYYFLDVC